MKMENYDQIIWRINGTLLLVACAGVVIFAIIAAISSLNNGRNRLNHDLVNINQNTKKEELHQLGHFEHLKGTDYLLAALTDEEKSLTSSYMKSNYNKARNYLVFNTKTKESFWIWKNNDSHIFSDLEIFDQVSDDKSKRTIGMVFELSDKDLLTSENNKISMLYFDLASKTPLAVVDDIDRSIGIQQTDKEQVLFFYSRSGKTYFKSLIISSKQLSSEQEIMQSL